MGRQSSWVIQNFLSLAVQSVVNYFYYWHHYYQYYEHVTCNLLIRLVGSRCTATTVCSYTVINNQHNPFHVIWQVKFDSVDTHNWRRALTCYNNGSLVGSGKYDPLQKETTSATDCKICQLIDYVAETYSYTEYGANPTTRACRNECNVSN